MRIALRVLAMLVAVHGLLFGATAWLVSSEVSGEESPVLAEAYFFGILVPALILAAPFTKLLWALRLMNAPGWFAWPRPLGFTLVYVCWVLALVGASYVAGAIARRRRPGIR